MSFSVFLRDVRCGKTCHVGYDSVGVWVGHHVELDCSVGCHEKGGIYERLNMGVIIK